MTHDLQGITLFYLPPAIIAFTPQPQSITAITYCPYPQRNGQAELTQGVQSLYANNG